MNSGKRFQMDEQWQADFRELVLATMERDEHVAACKQCHDYGAIDAARDELALADEAQERMDLLEHALKDFR